MKTVKEILIGFTLLSLASVGFVVTKSLAQDPIPNTAGTNSRPFSSRLVLNPTIQEMVDSVSMEIIISNLDDVVGFYTRQTNSDTLSPDTGVGATRRWIYRQFEEYRDDPDAFMLEPGYFTFNATVCGVSGEHRNVLATLPGTTTPERHFVVMGHMDGRTINVCDAVSFAPSANDDGSGTVIAMEVVRVMSRYSFESTIDVMIVTGEDQGLYGSTAYAEWAVDQGMEIGAAITNDVVGNIEGCENPSCPPGEPVIIDSTSVRHFSGIPDTGISRQLSRYMKLKALEYVPDFTINLIPARDRPGRSGDHVPFDNRGYAGVRFTEAHENGDGSGSNGRQHNEFDIISDLNTNAGYMANIAKINIAGIASLALAPKTPGGLETSNIGDGSSVILSWPAEQSEPDFAGYRIAVRPEGELFYSDIVDAGDENEYVLSGLVEGRTVYLSISAYDTDENESVFSEEIPFIPFSIPLAPEDLDATSEENGIQLYWVPNNELDIEGYGIYRKEAGPGDPELIYTVPHPASDWYDDTVSPHILYTYYVTAIDADQNESDFSNSVFGQLTTHDSGIIIVDGTLDGSGGPLQPTDDEVDDYYDTIFSGFNISGHWDIVDSSSAGMRFSDAHLAPFSIAVLHSDRLNAPLQQDTTALRKYLDNGGHLFLSGWNLSFTLAGVTTDFTVFPPGSFFREYLKVDSLGVSPPSNQDFVSAPSLMPLIYPDLVIDSAKVPIFDHRLLKMEAFLSPLVDEPLTEPLYVYESSLGEEFRLHGEPVGLRYLGDDLQLVFFDVPLYFIQQEPATVAARRALTDLGEIPVGIEDNNPSLIPGRIELYANYPNPFNAATVIRYSLPENSYVTLSVYNLLGQRVVVLAKGDKQAGEHIITWDASDFPSGFYFARLEVEDDSENIVMLLMK